MKRELKPEEHEEIVGAVAGDRIKATNIYLSATEGSLTEAQNVIKGLTVEAEAAVVKKKSVGHEYANHSSPDADATRFSTQATRARET